MAKICAGCGKEMGKSSGKRKQKIHISYDLTGFTPVDVLLRKAEQA